MRMTTAELSVVIPTFNAHQTIGKCLQSLERQTLKGFEVILVIDDGCEYLFDRPYSNFDLQVRTTRSIGSGPACARNIGIESSTREFITYLDADDWMLEHRLADLLELAKCTGLASDFPVISCNHATRNTREEGRFKAVKAIGLEDLLRLNFPLKLCHKNTKEIFFEESIRFAEDTIYNAALIEYFDDKISMLDYAGYYYAVSSGSLTDGDFNTIDENYSNLIGYLERCPYFGKEKELIQRFFWFKRGVNRLFFEYTKNFEKIPFQKFASRFLG